MKRFLSLLLTLVLLLSFTGCVGYDTLDRGKLYTLQEAFYEGYITHDDLLVIAENFNNDRYNTEELNEQAKSYILTLWARGKKKYYEDRDDVYVKGSYGSFRNSIEYDNGYTYSFSIHAVFLERHFAEGIEDEQPITIVVDGVAFNFEHTSEVRYLYVWLYVS